MFKFARHCLAPMAFAAGLLLGGIVAITVAAGASSSPPTYYGCLHNGTLSKVGTTMPSCMKGYKRISWNSVGPQGIQGVQGVQGVPGPTTGVTETVEWNPSWTTTGPGGFAVTNTSTMIETGSVLTAVTATATGDLSSCTGGYMLTLSLEYSSGSNFLAEWVGISRVLSSSAATVDVGDSQTATASTPLSVGGACYDSSGDPINVPVVSFQITLTWTHPPRVIS